MNRIAMMVPSEEMYWTAHYVLQTLRKSSIRLERIENGTALDRARVAIKEGAEIIIARGVQASTIRRYTDISVVELRLTRNNIVTLIRKGKRLLPDVSHPRIALIAFRNMSCETRGIEEECNVDLLEYYVSNSELLASAVEQAITNQADLIIGGHTAMRIAEEAHLPAVFLTSTDDAIEAALREAEDLLHSVQKKGPVRSLADPRKTFVNFSYKSALMTRCIDLAWQLSHGSSPKLIVEPVGNLSQEIAMAMHNASRFSENRLFTFTCTRSSSSYDALFGEKGIAREARGGTLRIDHIEFLDERSQYALLDSSRFLHIIALAKTEDYGRRLVPELAELFRAFTIRIPTLDECREDIPSLTSEYFARICASSEMYHVLSQKAMHQICRMEWPGNRLQLETFLERLILTAPRRSISDRDVRSLYAELYADKWKETRARKTALPDMESAQDDEEIGALSRKQMEREMTLKTLQENMGDRRKTAAALGVSTTTLWRRLKKYGM